MLEFQIVRAQDCYSVVLLECESVRVLEGYSASVRVLMCEGVTVQEY